MNSDLTSLVAALVAIDSVNPSLVSGGAGEDKIVTFIESWSRANGLESERLEETRGRLGAWSCEPAARVAAARCFSAVTSTLSMSRACRKRTCPRVDGDRLYGRGDIWHESRSVAAALLAAREVASAGLPGDVVVAAVADEEHSSLGIQESLTPISAGRRRRYGADAAAAGCCP